MTTPKIQRESREPLIAAITICTPQLSDVNLILAAKWIDDALEEQKRREVRRKAVGCE